MQILKHTIEVILYDERRPLTPVRSLFAKRLPAPWLFEAFMIIGWFFDLLARLGAAVGDLGATMRFHARAVRRALWLAVQAFAQGIGLVLVWAGLIETTFGLLYTQAFFRNLAGEVRHYVS